jgi:DNA mismatch endonuclease, patch repair protein
MNCIQATSVIMDIYSRRKRSEIMSNIRSVDTKPEIIVRRQLHSLGYRFRLHYKDLPGCPDIVLPKYHAVIFVHGCFWHHHMSCAKSRLPKSNVQFWTDKISTNVQRDKRNMSKLKRLGWHVLVVWECETTNKKLDMKLIRFLKR